MSLNKLTRKHVYLTDSGEKSRSNAVKKGRRKRQAKLMPLGDSKGRRQSGTYNVDVNLVCDYGCFKRQVQRERERERERDTHTHTHTHTHTQTERQRQRHRDTERERQTDRQTERERRTDRQRQRHGPSDRLPEGEEKDRRDSLIVYILLLSSVQTVISSANNLTPAPCYQSAAC